MNAFPVASIVVVSYNTRDLLRTCLQTLERDAGEPQLEVLVVDNLSRDGSAEMVEREFPAVQLLRSPANLGFAAANNLAFPHCRGRYVVLLNSDAFLKPQSLPKAIARMDADPRVGLAGARLMGPNGDWQPSARLFPSLLNDFLILSGLSTRYPRSRLFGRVDRTWASPDEAAQVDWVPGAFSIIRRDVLDNVGYFDEKFFLYYEEVDLCRRIKDAGFTVWYWPDIQVVHLGGESSKTLSEMTMSAAGSQLTLWRMRSALIYYRKHHGTSAWLAKQMETFWHFARARKHLFSRTGEGLSKAEESKRVAQLLVRAWQETQGGRISPARPW